MTEYESNRMMEASARDWQAIRNQGLPESEQSHVWPDEPLASEILDTAIEEEEELDWLARRRAILDRIERLEFLMEGR